MANPAPTINQINAFNATQGTTIDFNIIGGTELVRSNRIYIYDLSDNSLICTHLYVSTESIHELPPNTDGSIVYESGKSSADFVNGAQYYAQIQTFTDIAGTEGGSGLSVAKMFWCLVDPTLTITTIPSTISTTSYNVSAIYNANTSVVSNIIQQYQFSLYSATGSLLQSSGVVVGSGTQQGTSTAYDISYNFTGLSVGSSYYVVVDVTTTQGMSVSVQSNTFTVSIDTPTLGEATVVNNACDGYISVTSNLSGEYGGSGSGEIVSFETDSENVFTKLQVDLEPVQDLNGYDKPWVGGAGKNKLPPKTGQAGAAQLILGDDATAIASASGVFLKSGEYTISVNSSKTSSIYWYDVANSSNVGLGNTSEARTVTVSTDGYYFPFLYNGSGITEADVTNFQLESGTNATSWTPYENICPITGHDEVDVSVVGKNLFDASSFVGTGITLNNDGSLTVSNNNYIFNKKAWQNTIGYNGQIVITYKAKFSTTNVGGIPQVYYTDGTHQTVPVSSTQEFMEFTLISSVNKIVDYISFTYASASSQTTFFMQIELGTTATTYHPYNGQTYIQEIEATYTPTAQENEPYQFKRTGDVGGDRESIELIGGSVVWNQLVQNGDFSDGIMGWSKLDANITVSDGVLTFSRVADRVISTIYQTVSVPQGHKCLYSATVKGDSSYSSWVWSFGSSEVYDLPITPEWNTVNRIISKATSSTAFNAIRKNTVANDEIVYAKNIYFIDLTQLFGSTIADYIYSLEQGQAGAGVAFFRKYFPLSYYPHDSGTIKSVEGVSAHVTTGFNQWDEEWEVGSLNTTTGANVVDNTVIRSKNYIPCVPNTAYYANNGAVKCFYDADKNYISYLSHSVATEFTTPSNAHYMRFRTPASYGTTYNNDICINLSWDGERNGEYEPYVEHSYPLDDSLTLRGIPKIANGKLYYDGDTYKSDGSVSRKWTTRNMSAFTTSHMSNLSVGDNTVRIYINMSSMKPNVTTTEINILADKLNCYTPDYIVSNDVEGISENRNANDNGFWIRISKSKLASNDYAGMVSYFASNPINVLYELKTPTIEQAEPFENIQEVTPNYGTEEFVTTTNVPVGNNTQYYTRDIYGGYIDLVSGVLTVTKGIADFGAQTWYYSSGLFWAAIDNFAPPSDYLSRKTGFICSSYPADTQITLDSSAMTDNSLLRLQGRIYVKNTAYTDAATFKTAMSGVQLCYDLATPQTYQLTPQQIQTLVGVNNVWSEQGDVELSYHIPITNLLVKRQDVADVSGDWLTLYSQPITQASDMDFTFIDFTNQYGKTYKYALVPLLTQTQSGVEVEVEGGYTVSDEVQSVFDGVFIADSTGSQKCKANVGYGNVDMNQAVGTITPIGAKYPVVITNSQNQYHNGSISGTIVPDDYYFNGNLSRIDMVNKRDELEQFLTNKRAKIIKDWNGKIWLVMIMDNVSCTFNNNYGMGIVNFSTNWVEVGDPTNQEDLQATGLINVGGV